MVITLMIYVKRLCIYHLTFIKTKLQRKKSENYKDEDAKNNYCNFKSEKQKNKCSVLNFN